MKFVKQVMLLAVALCAIPSLSQAQTVQAVGGGSSAIFLELGQGAAAGTGVGYTNTPCTWTSGKSANIVARDTRTTPVTDEQGSFWVTWSAGSTGTCAAPAGTGINIYSYIQLDSVVGNKCYFMVDATGTPGCVQVLTVAAGTAGANKLAGYTDTPIPANIISAVNGQHFSYAGTDIRPEDAQFATERMFQPCGAIVYRNPYDLEYRLTYGLGYASGTPNVGLKVNSAFSSSYFNVINYNFAGPDPFTGFNSPQFTASPVGAQPIVVMVAPASDTTGIGGATDVNGHTLALFYDGVLARTTDFPGVTNTLPVVTLVREPLSGTYNTFEYSVPNSSQFHKSQDDNFCSGSAVYSQTMNIGSSTGVVPGAARERVIGTGEMVAQLQAATTSSERLGYAFWSAANMAGLSNVKYLTVNGVDPLLDSYGDNGTYTAGALPQATPGPGVPPLTAVSFKNLNLGDYPAWSAVRVIGLPGSVPVATLLNSLGLIDPTQHDYITKANMKVWHTHFPIYGIVGGFADGPTLNPATPGDLCTGGSPEVGGDVGAANLLKQVNADFCADYGNPTGLVNQVN